MQAILISCLFGAICAMGMWAAFAGCDMRDAMMRRDSPGSPPDDL